MSKDPTAPATGKRARRASFRLADEDNEGNIELASHRDARREAREIQAQLAASRAADAAAHSTPSHSRNRTSTRNGSVSCEEADDDDDGGQTDESTTTKAPPKKKRKKATPSAKKSKRSGASGSANKKPNSSARSTPDVQDAETRSRSTSPLPSGVEDAEVIDLGNTSGSESEPEEEKAKRDPTLDLKTFFEKPCKRGPEGKKKVYRRCKLCAGERYIAEHITSFRRHLQAYHKKRYEKWCKKSGFVSMLPKESAARRDDSARADSQTTLDGHTVPLEPHVPTVKYTDKLFKEAAEDWLIMTNQPLSALSHPSFRNMIDVASRATDGVKIPEVRATRASIIRRFEENVMDLRNRLNSDKVRGEVSMTCDAWQAANKDAYFAVTGHWVEEVSPSDWRLKSGLLGFTQMNTAHNGARLGRALYAIAKRYRITHKIGWVTCDNASNNLTMLKVFETKVNQSTRRARTKKGKWEASKRHIRCLAHIINLATQAVLSEYSKTPHINTDSTTEDVDKTLTSLAEFSACRDEVGLVRVIAVKARSSAKHNALIKELQAKDGVAIPLSLILDMKVQWSSTLAMLERVYGLREYINQFIFKISQEETNATKRRALEDLRMTSEEWDRVNELIKVLKHADEAQHAFSADSEPTLSNAIPALEKLHKKWMNMTTKPKYSRYHASLHAGLEKVSTYYNKTTGIDAYDFSMILDPSLKTSHFRKHWGNDLELATRRNAERLFEDRWKELNTMPTTTATSQPLTSRHSKSRLDCDDSSDDEQAPASALTSAATDKPWLKEFNRYIDGDDDLDDGQSVVAWWGIHSRRLPTWASLARDYLAIMASSVSSERAFSAAGITISKRRSSLKADIVEALQVLKSLLNNDLIFREPDPTLHWELENEVEEDDGDSDWVDEGMASDSENECVL